MDRFGPSEATRISPAWLADPAAVSELWSAQDYRAAALNAQYEDTPTLQILEEMIDFEFQGRLALVSSFGTQSAVLLSLIAEVDPSLPVLFIDTGKLFPETLSYRDQLTDHLGLSDVRSVSQKPSALKFHDPHGALWMNDTQTCCDLRKVEPLDHALSDFDAWISGRKRFQGGERTQLPVFEADGPHIKINPLATWSKSQIESYAKARALPEHPLLKDGYRSVGCAPCTQKTPEGADDRAGRWNGLSKTECGIHLGGRQSNRT